VTIETIEKLLRSISLQFLGQFLIKLQISGASYYRKPANIL